MNTHIHLKIQVQQNLVYGQSAPKIKNSKWNINRHITNEDIFL